MGKHLFLIPVKFQPPTVHDDHPVYIGCNVFHTVGYKYDRDTLFLIETLQQF